MKRFAILVIAAFFLTFSVSAQIMRPVPQDVQMYGKKTSNLSRGVVVTDLKGDVKEYVDFVKVGDTGVKLILDYGKTPAAQYGLKEVSGAYRLEVTPKEIYVTGYDRRGVFYGLQTLRHMMETAEKNSRVPCCLICDWPDKEVRGVVEGYYGAPWQQKFRLSMIRSYADLKMSAYVYAPEGDPCVKGEDWYMPYTETKASEMKELMSECTKHGLDFIWCMRLDDNFTWSDSDMALLMGKFEMMYFLGVRNFGLLFDAFPEGVDGNSLKEGLIERVNSDFIAKKKDASELLTDLDDFYVPEDDGESLHLSVYGVADRYWNEDAFDSAASLDWALDIVAPEVKDSYRTFVMNADFIATAFDIQESGYIALKRLNDYSAEGADEMIAEFKRMEAVKADFEANASKELYSDLEPWLVEFEKMSSRSRRIVECMIHYNSSDVTSFWSVYAENLMSEQEIAAYKSHPSGLKRLHPYYEKMMSDLYEAFNDKQKDKVDYEHLSQDGMEIYLAPSEAEGCYLIMNNPESKEVIIRLADATGKYVAEFCMNESYFEFELKENAIKVEILSDIEVFETIFVNNLE